MPGLVRRLGTVVAIAVLACICGWTQDVPDAPQPKIPPSGSNPFPDAPPAPKNNHQADDPSAPPPGDALSDSSQPGPSADGIATSRNDLFTIRARVTFIEIPVAVKDSSDHLVEGLSDKDFTVYEDGTPQRLSFFNSEPFPLSAAVVVDTNLPAATMKKINETLPALVGAFSEFDEVALYRYGNS